MRKILRNENFSGALANVSGMVVGVVNTMWLLPLIFSLEQIGFYRWLERSAMVLSQILLIGMHRVYIKFYSKLEAEDRRVLMNQILSIVLGISLVLLIVLLSTSGLIAGFLNIEDFESDIWLLGILVPAFMFFLLGSSTASVKGEIKIPFLWRSLALRLILFGSGLLVVFQFIRFDNWLIVQVLASVSVGIGVLLWSLKKVRWRPVSQFLYRGGYLKDMKLFGLFNSLNSFLTFTLNILDIQFVLIFLGPAELGVYSIASFIALFIDGIKRPLSQSAIPRFSKYWNDKDFIGLSQYYKKTSLILTIVAIGAYLFVVPNLGLLISFIPDSNRFIGVVPLIKILLLSRIIDYSLGYNGEILANGPDYKLNLYLSGIMLLLLVLANFVLISNFGIIGAPIAFLLVNSLFNTIKAYYLYRKRSWTPFSISQLIVFFSGALLFVPITLFDDMNYLHLVLRLSFAGIWSIIAWRFSKGAIMGN